MFDQAAAQANQDRISSTYGVQQSGMAVDANYHAEVDHDRRWTLAEVAKAGGKINRVRMLHERRLLDISYVHATLPSGQLVRVNTVHCPESFLIHKNRIKGVFIEWAKAEKVFAKGLGLLDESNWSILW